MYLSYRGHSNSTTNLSQSGPGSKSNEELLLIFQIAKTGASPSDAVKCYT